MKASFILEFFKSNRIIKLTLFSGNKNKIITEKRGLYTNNLSV